MESEDNRITVVGIVVVVRTRSIDIEEIVSTITDVHIRRTQPPVVRSTRYRESPYISKWLNKNNKLLLITKYN